MPARKSAPRKAGSVKAASSANLLNAGALPPYGNPIRDAIARGDAAEMKQISTSARKYLKDVQAAVAQLDRAMSNRKG